MYVCMYLLSLFLEYLLIIAHIRICIYVYVQQFAFTNIRVCMYARISLYYIFSYFNCNYNKDISNNSNNNNI